LVGATTRIKGLTEMLNPQVHQPEPMSSRMDTGIHAATGNMRIGGMAIRYSQFVPKLYNYCLSLGFDRNRIMPSRAFCSDESQGYPVILLAQHFGTFPFDHGVVGGRVATDRHGPHAHHGEDLVIVQASHVGYDAERRRFGLYQRKRTVHGEFGANCGKLSAVLAWYQEQYRKACGNILLGSVDGVPALYIDNEFLDQDRQEGLFLHLDRLIDPDRPVPLRILSTSKAFALSGSSAFAPKDAGQTNEKRPIGDRLTPELFYFRRQPVIGPEGLDLLERAIMPAMPFLVRSPHPALDAARHHTQVEFDRAYRTIQSEPAYAGKNVLFVSGLNIDVSPSDALQFPLTKFVPWAAYARLRNGDSFLLEQAALFDALIAQPSENADEIALDAAIKTMERAESIELPAL
jgi:hypothetical protein